MMKLNLNKTPPGQSRGNKEMPSGLEIYFVVTLFVTGAAVMILEIVGAKMVHPFFGVTLYVWAAMIAVTLLSLAAGYSAGGWFADRFPYPQWLFRILSSTAVLLVFIPLLASPLMLWSGRFELRISVLFSSFAIFFFPLFFLGMVTPYVIKLRLHSLQTTGKVTGNLYAISTVGSLIGTLLAGFYLIPNFGIRNIFMALAVVLFVLAVLGSVMAGTFRRPHIILVLLVVCLFFAVLTLYARHGKAGDSPVLHEVHSPYGHIQVVEMKGIRALLVNGAPQNYYRLGANPYDFFSDIQYDSYFAAVQILRPRLETALMIGLGSGHMAGYFSRYGIETDIIEIDPAMKEVAEKYFGFKASGGELYLGDGRAGLRKMKQRGKRYGAILLDAFASYDLPEHLFTREMFLDVRQALTEDGVLAMNVGAATEGLASRVPRAVLATLKEVFRYVRVFAVTGKTDATNLVFYASQQPLAWQAKECRIMDCPKQEKFIEALASRDITEKWESGMILTDDYNPISYWNLPVYEAYRNRVVNFFGKDLLSKTE